MQARVDVDPVGAPRTTAAAAPAEPPPPVAASRLAVVTHDERPDVRLTFSARAPVTAPVPRAATPPPSPPPLQRYATYYGDVAPPAPPSTSPPPARRPRGRSRRPRVPKAVSKVVPTAPAATGVTTSPPPPQAATPSPPPTRRVHFPSLTPSPPPVRRLRFRSPSPAACRTTHTVCVARAADSFSCAACRAPSPARRRAPHRRPLRDCRTSRASAKAWSTTVRNFKAGLPAVVDGTTDGRISLMLDATHMLTQVEVNGAPARALVDTGATVGAVSSHWLARLDPTVRAAVADRLAASDVSIAVGDGHMSASLGTLPSATLTLADKTITSTLQVLALPSGIDLILSTAELGQLRAIIAFDGSPCATLVLRTAAGTCHPDCELVGAVWPEGDKVPVSPDLWFATGTQDTHVVGALRSRVEHHVSGVWEMADAEGLATIEMVSPRAFWTGRTDLDGVMCIRIDEGSTARLCSFSESSSGKL
eukprot:m.62319 g.62319  ORF g.62319 m.62319 type:complete len:478 (-) comp8079_c0_seq1:308-1741(-)